MVKRPTSVPKMHGVEALLSQAPKTNLEKTTSALQLNKIHLPQSQPRRYFDPDKMEQLVQSIKEHGIIEPLLVRYLPNGNYELVAGERRLRAAQIIGISEIPVILRELDDQQAFQISLVENLQREDLNPIEETEGILQLLAITLKISPDQVTSLFHNAYNARQRGRELNDNVTIQLQSIENVLSVIGRFNSESFRSNRLPLLKLPSDVLEVLRQGKLEYTKARAISRVKDLRKRQDLLESAILENLSLKEIKHIVSDLNTPDTNREKIQAEKFNRRFSEVSKRLKNVEIWRNSERRKLAEKLLLELEKLADG